MSEQIRHVQTDSDEHDESSEARAYRARASADQHSENPCNDSGCATAAPLPQVCLSLLLRFRFEAGDLPIHLLDLLLQFCDQRRLTGSLLLQRLLVAVMSPANFAV